jgi:hypothetical protein
LKATRLAYFLEGPPLPCGAAHGSVLPGEVKTLFVFRACSVWPVLGQAALVVAINHPLGQPAARARHGSHQASSGNPVSAPRRGRQNAGYCLGSNTHRRGGFSTSVCQNRLGPPDKPCRCLDTIRTRYRVCRRIPEDSALIGRPVVALGQAIRGPPDHRHARCGQIGGSQE